MPEPAARLEGTVAVITGTASGVGRATALLFAEEGAKVVGIDRSESGNASLLEELQVRGKHGEMHTVDLRDRTAVQECCAEIARRHPSIDVLFNNAGAAVAKPIPDTTADIWDEMLEVNLTAAFLLIRDLLPCLERARAGAIVNHASIDGLFGHPLLPAYSTAKGGMLAMSRSFALPLGRAGVRINAIASGGIETPLIDSLEFGDDVRARITEATPLGRWCKPEEVARVALFLATEDSSYITGAVLTVDGGRTAVTPGTLEP